MIQRGQLLCLLLLSIAAQPHFASAQSIELKSGDQALTVDLAPFPVSAKLLWNAGHTTAFEGPLLDDVLKRLPSPRRADTVAIRCSDGWLSLLSLEAVHRASGILAVRVRDSGKLNGTLRPLVAPQGPVRLLVGNAALGGKPSPHTESLHAEIAENGDAWGVVSIELVRREDFLARTAPARDASQSVRQGHDFFISHCLHCHAWKGVGGISAWDLSDPPLFTYRDEDRVRGYLLDPRKLNPEGHMPSFAKQLEGTPLLGHLIEFLKTAGAQATPPAR